MSKIVAKMRGRLNACLSFIKEYPFDVGLYVFIFLSPIFFLKSWDLNMIQGIFFVLGIFALLGISFISKKQVEYKNKYLGFILLWSLLCLLIHSFNFSLTNGLTSSFINYCILSEGFIFILCGCILYYLVVCYKKNFNIVYPILAINILNLFFVIFQKFGINFIWSNPSGICGMMGTKSQLALFSAISVPILAHHNYYGSRMWIPLCLIPITIMFLALSYTSVFSLFIGIALYIYVYDKRRNWARLTVWLGLGILFFIIFHHEIIIKAQIRLELIEKTLLEILQKPLFGWGFDNTLTMNKIHSRLENGMCFRHNDFLNIAKDLGIPFLIFIMLGLKRILKNATKDYLWVACVILLLGCAFQTNAYFARIASIGIIILALKERQNYENLC